MTKSPKTKKQVVSPNLRSKFFPGRFRRSSADGAPTSPPAARHSSNSTPVSPESPLATLTDGRGAAASLIDCLAIASRPEGSSGAGAGEERVELEGSSAGLESGEQGSISKRSDEATTNNTAEAPSRTTISPTTPKPTRAVSPTATTKPLPQLPTPSTDSNRTSFLLDGNTSATSSELDGGLNSARQELATESLERSGHARNNIRGSDAPENTVSLNEAEAEVEAEELKKSSNTGLRDLTEGIDPERYRSSKDEGTGLTEHTELSPTALEHFNHRPIQQAELNPVTTVSAIVPTTTPRFQLLEPSPPPLPTDHRRTILAVDDPEEILRKQSLANQRDHQLVRNLLQTHDPRPPHRRHGSGAYESGANSSLALDRKMVHRKIWVKRPGASATLVQITEDDLVDDVRDMILKKYANSLGRSFDAPDVTLRIISREHSHSHRHAPAERLLGPEEHMTRTLDAYYPGGQTVDEALIIDVPIRRTPRQSPRVALPYYSSAAEDMRPAETDQGYFPPIQPGTVPSPLPIATSVSAGSDRHGHHHHHSISVLNTGMVPPLPSPGSRTTRSGHRPRVARNNTSSPTAVTSQPPLTDNRLLSNAPIPPPLPTPPLAAQPPVRTATPPPPSQSPRPQKQKRPSKKNTIVSGAPTSHPGPLLDGSVPPINVLIVEDNIINLKLLEAFMKRLKVRWHTAMNGREAVTKWKNGGFHLVLMDIQLPIMSGLEATKEIRRLERCNGVGVLAATDKASATEAVPDKDRLEHLELFKSSVIIVALTASSLQSDRHEALAAGCNDFLTKPVNFVWLERKVTEWGCMQALIDFDGWRRWKEPANAKGSTTTAPAKKTDPKSKSSSTPSSRTTSPRLNAPAQFAPASDSMPRALGAGVTSSASSEHSNPGNGTGDAPNRPIHSSNTDGTGGPGVTVQSPTPPIPPSTSPAAASNVDDAASAPSNASSKKPSPLQQSATASSPPMDGESEEMGSPSSRRNGTTGNQWSPRDREAEPRRPKRASSGVGNTGGLSGVVEEDGEGAGREDRGERKVESVGA